MTKQDLTKAFGSLDIQKKNREHPLPGILGFTLNGVKKVNVPTRNGFVYVRLRNSTNELIQAFNDQVSPVYDLPVLVIRDEVDRTRYKIVGRDLGIYQNWGSNSPFLPSHGNTHSFSPDTGGGGDVTYVYSRQLMPLAVYPSGTSGAGNVMVSAHTYYQNAQWWYAGGTGTSSLLTYKPTGSTAVMVLVYLDENANPKLLGGSTHFTESITGTSAIVPYLPTIADTRYVPLAGIRLVSGTSVILWDNIYDLRPWIVGDGFIPTGTFAPNDANFVTIGNNSELTNERALVGGAGISVTDSGANGNVTIAFTGTVSTLSVPTYPAIYDDNVFKTTGTAIHYNNNLAVIVSGTSVWIDGSAAGGGSDLLIYDDNVLKTTGTAIHFNDNLSVIVTGSSVWVDAVGVTGTAGSPGTAGPPGAGFSLIYDDSVFKVTGTSISFDNNLSVAVTGTTAFVSSQFFSFEPGGRLSLTSGTPVTTTDIYSGTVLWYNPYKHDQLPLYNGNDFVPITFTPTPISLSGLSGTSSFDVFAYNNGGVPAYETSMWSSATVRTIDLSYVKGRLVKSTDPTRLYLGSFYTSSSGQTDDALLKQFVWNNYNDVPKNMYVTEQTSHNYTTNTERNWNNNAGVRVQFMVGVSGRMNTATVEAELETCYVMCSYDITGFNPVGTLEPLTVYNANSGLVRLAASAYHYPAIGYHYYQASEYGLAGATQSKVWISAIVLA